MLLHKTEWISTRNAHSVTCKDLKLSFCIIHDYRFLYTSHFHFSWILDSTAKAIQLVYILMMILMRQNIIFRLIRWKFVGDMDIIQLSLNFCCFVYCYIHSINKKINRRTLNFILIMRPCAKLTTNSSSMQLRCREKFARKYYDRMGMPVEVVQWRQMNK